MLRASTRLAREINPEFTVEVPLLYDDQQRAWDELCDEQYAILRCGRRYGKTAFGGNYATDGVVAGEPVGWFAPSYKIMSEVYHELSVILDPIKIHASKTDGIIRCVGGGRVDFWTLENLDAGRSRKYGRIVIDEGAFTNNETMMDQWEKSIEPTLADYDGKVLVCSNTNGVDQENFLYRISPGGADKPKPGAKRGARYQFKEYHAPSSRNPYLSAKFLANKKANSHPLVWRQEYLAEFVDFSGVSFFSKDSLTVNGEPVPSPTRCDGVFAVVDSAAKTGKDNDGTAVTYYALINNVLHPLLILDWDIVQIEGSLLDTWLQGVFLKLEQLARDHKARGGSLGVHIEDKSTGTVLIQQAKRRGWNVHEINSKLTAMGKDERAMNASGYVYTGKVKYTRAAFHKVTVYKEVSRNHHLHQVTGFRIGDKEAAKRADDLLDTFTYGVSIALGDPDGW
jgi:hypothetical protein